MKSIIHLIKKDFLIDWRQQHPLTGVLLYLASTIFASYMAFSGFLDIEVWNVLFWIILLFASVNAISKSFVQEDRRSIYYYFLTTPEKIIISKLIYSFIYLTSLSLLALMLYSILFGNPVDNYLLFLLNLVLGSIGLASAFTMVSAIAFRANNRAVMMVILSFPVVVPVLVVAISNSNKILEGSSWMQVQSNMLTLFSVDVVIIALIFVLFPFVWKA